MKEGFPSAIPLADWGDRALTALAAATGSAQIAALDGATLLGERAALAGMTIPGRIAAGGSCRLLRAVGDTVALNLARTTDREMLPALFEDDALDPGDDPGVAARVARSDAGALVARGRSMGLAIASIDEGRVAAQPPWVELSAGRSTTPKAHRPRVLDLSALWAGPLAGHLLWLAGCEVIKVESRARPDAMRCGQPAFHALLNQGKANVLLDLQDTEERGALLALMEGADIVIEAARPRALQQLGIDADRMVHERPGLVWLTLTGHGAEGEAANWIGFGDDCAVAAGLSAALFAVTGMTGFVGDAIADPLTGVLAAQCAWTRWSEGRGGRIGLALADTVAAALDDVRTRDPDRLGADLAEWAARIGRPFPAVRPRPASQARPLGADAPRWRPASC